MRTIGTLIVILLLTNLCAKQYNILFINSYSQSNPWSDAVSHGLFEVFDKYENLVVYNEYMDTQKFTFEQSERNLINSIDFKYRGIKFDIVLTSDDNAFDFVRFNRKELFNEIPFIYCGVNNKDYSSVGTEFSKGIFESTDVVKNLDLINFLNPETEKLIVLGDSSKTAQILIGDIDKISLTNRYDFQIKIINTKNFLNLKKELLENSGNCAVYSLIFENNLLANGVDFRNTTKYVKSNYNYPVYSSWTYMLDTGIDGGFLTNGIVHGRNAARLAVNLLRLDSRDLEMEDETELYLDYNKYHDYMKVLENYGYHPKYFSEPESLLKKYKDYIYMLVLVILALFISLFLFYYYQYRKKLMYEKKIESSEKRFRTIFQNSLDSEFITDSDRIYDCNNSALSILKMKYKDDVIGKTISDFIHSKDEWDSVRNVLCNFNGEAHKRSNICLTFYKKKKYFDVVSTEVFLDDKKLVHSVWRDITEETKMYNRAENNEIFFRSVFNSNPNIIVIVNENLNIESLNQSAVKILDLHEDGNISTIKQKIQDYESFHSLLSSQISATGSMIFNQVLFVNNQLKNYKIILTSFEDKEQNRKMQIVFNDITDLKTVESKLKVNGIRLTDFGLMANDFFWETDSSLNIIFISKNAEKLLGQPLDQLLRSNIKELFGEQSFDEIDYDEHNTEIKSFKVYLKNEAIDKSLSISFKKIYANDLFTGLRGVAMDCKIDDKQCLEDNSEHLNSYKNFGREIRTSLTGFLGMTQILQKTNLDENQKEIVSIINESGRSLMDVVHDLLDFVNIRNLDFVNENHIFDLGSSISGIIDVLKIENINITFHNSLKDHFSVSADKERIERIIKKIIIESHKVVKDYAYIHCKFDLISNDDKDYLKFVCDISKKDLESFNLLGLLEQDIGFNFHLMIIRELIQYMKGEFEEVIGDDFISFKIMIEVVSVYEKLNEVKDKNKSKRRLKIIVAEDNEINQKLIQAMLCSLGHEVTIVSNGLEFLEEVNKNYYDLAFMDGMMPIMDGIEAVKELRRREITKGRRIPVIALTAQALIGDKKRFLEAGMDEYIPKPVILNELRRVIDNYT
ncbi:MAG: response regulator [Candidatus Delongbacteria bacterium]|nr:response regulator [Candidatus Delongbacteria bacterium]MBN2835438.1 response regulator [Candidatus Delongbacteria bacterium]